MYEILLIYMWKYIGYLEDERLNAINIKWQNLQINFKRQSLITKAVKSKKWFHISKMWKRAETTSWKVYKH